MSDTKPNDETTETAEQIETTKRPRAHRRESWRIVAGGILILFGITLLLERSTGVNLSWIPLAIGIAFLTFWQRDRSYGFLIPGAILTGFGAGSIIESLFAGPWVDGVSTLLLAAGFMSIWYLDRAKRRSWWAKIVGLILGIIGLFKLVPDLPSLFDIPSAEILLPAAVITLGLVMLLRGSIPRGVYQVLVVILIVLAIAAASKAVGGNVGFDLFGGVRRETTRSIELDRLSGKTLVVESTSGDIEVTEGDLSAKARIVARADSEARARALLRSAEVEVVDEGDELIIRPQDGQGLSHVSFHFQITVPEGQEVRLVSSSGDISIVGLRDSAVEMRTASGDVEIGGTYSELKISTASGDIEGTVDMSSNSLYEVRTASGDVDLLIDSSDPEISIETASGDINVSDFDGESEQRSFQRSGTSGTISISTASGDVDLARKS